ncbi:hypothetical protein Tco_0807292 [Tanacetum coccineum]
MFLNSLTQTDKPQNTQFTAPVIKPQKDYEEFDNVESFEHLFMAEPENAESTVQFDAEDYEEHQENLNQETPTEFPNRQKQYLFIFTFDDVPPSKWRERSIEMLTWCTAELQYYTINVVIKRFLTRLQRRLRDWYHSLGEYRQLQIQQSISPEAFMSIIYSEFIGSPWEHTAHAREEFLKMECCSFQKKDLEKHYDRMSQRFYCLNGVDDVNLKQKKFLAEFERTGKRLGTACDDKYLQIKCKDKSSCDCTHTKKKFHSKRYSSLSGKPRFSRRSSKKWKFIRKKKQRGRTSDRCFICQKRGHFAKIPDKKRSSGGGGGSWTVRSQGFKSVEPVDVSDLESLYSLDDEPSDSVLCTIAYSDFSSDDDSDTDSLESDSDFGVHMINPIPHVLPIQEDPPLPLAKVHLLTDAYAKPVSVIAFFDTGSSVSILNPNVLSRSQYEASTTKFHAAISREKFVIDKIAFLAARESVSSGQLGSKPGNRPKNSFCIPDQQLPVEISSELLSKVLFSIAKMKIMFIREKDGSWGYYNPIPCMEISSLGGVLRMKGGRGWITLSWRSRDLSERNSESNQVPSRKDASTKDSCLFPQKKESCRQMQVMSVRERSYLFKIIIIKETFMDTRVARLKHLSSIITPRSKKSLQSKRGIEESFLVSANTEHEFQVEMDMSSFPRML